MENCGKLNLETGNSLNFLNCMTNSVYYMHNEEIPQFSNKLKVIITSGLRRFISSKEIFPCSRFLLFQYIQYITMREHMNRVDVFLMTSCQLHLGRCQQHPECKMLDLEATLK